MIKKIVEYALVLVFLGVFSVHAATPAPVWVTPADAKAKSAVTLNALVYNNTASDVTFTVAFTSANTEIATATIVVPKDTGKSATAAWTMPLEKTIVAATVRSALDKNKKHILALEGALGSVTVGGVATIAIPENIIPKGLLSGTLAPLEAWRVKQVAHYTALRESSKIQAKRSGIEDAANLLIPDSPGALGSEAAVSETKKGHAMDYATFIFASAAASFFSHQAIFYIGLILIGILILRFVFKLFI